MKNSCRHHDLWITAQRSRHSINSHDIKIAAPNPNRAVQSTVGFTVFSSSRCPRLTVQPLTISILYQKGHSTAPEFPPVPVGPKIRSLFSSVGL